MSDTPRTERTQLQAWYNLFGTTQLSHAIAHRDKLERDLKAMRRERDEAYARAALKCFDVALSPSSLWEEKGCWAHAAEYCATEILALKEKP